MAVTAEPVFKGLPREPFFVGLIIDIGSQEIKPMNVKVWVLKFLNLTHEETY